MSAGKFWGLVLTVSLLIGTVGVTCAHGYTLVWSDEFDGTSLNMSNWNYEIGGHGWGNNELQYYTDRNVTVANGVLTITAKRESYGGRDYTSSRITTKGKREFKYGRIEARISIPMGQGLWPAFWMLGANFPGVPWPNCGEIDIMEHVNRETATHGYIHWDYNGHAYYGGSTYVADPSAWHVYAIEWDQSAIKWFVDGVQFWEANIHNGINNTHCFHEPFFIILNLAVGGNWPGPPDAGTKFPAEYKIDYVRVYQKSAGPTPTPTPVPGQGPYGGVPWVIPGTIQAENYDTGGQNVAYYDTTSGNSGGAYRSDHVDIEPCTDSGGGYNVGWIENGEWLEYTVNVTQAGTYDLEARVASLSAGGSLSVSFNGVNKTGTMSFGPTGGWQNWTTVRANGIYLNAGQQIMRINMLSTEFNLNWVRLTRTSGPTPTPTPPPGGSPAKTWYLFNQAVSGVNPPGENMQTGKSGVTGWQPTKTINETSLYWYSPVLNGTYPAGNWSFILWTNNPGSTSNVRVRFYRVNADGSGATLLGDQTINVTATGTGNHPTTFNFNVGTLQLNNQRLMIRIVKSSGVNATMAYNTNDFPTRLLAP